MEIRLAHVLPQKHRDDDGRGGGNEHSEQDMAVEDERWYPLWCDSGKSAPRIVEWRIRG